MDGLPFLVVILLMVGVVRCLDKSLDDRWERFKRANNRKYKEGVEVTRRLVWETKVREIEQHNKEAALGVHSYSMRETEWDDLTFVEFIYPESYFEYLRSPPRPNPRDIISIRRPCSAHDVIKNDELPISKDWTEEGFVTSVKNQKPGLTDCGACWAFAAVGAAEAHLFKKTNTLVNLSAQSLVDCSVHNGGCIGGLPKEAFMDFIDLPGIPTEESYPYEAENSTCRLSFAKIGARIEDCKIVNTDEELLNALAFAGPVTVAIQTGPKFQNLGDGVYTDCTGDLNHAVLVVGYGVHKGKQVWKFKNSHGSNWGDRGYFYIPRDTVNPSSINNIASYPIVNVTIVEGDATNINSSAVVNHEMLHFAFSVLLSLAVLEARIT